VKGTEGSTSCSSKEDRCQKSTRLYNGIDGDVFEGEEGNEDGGRIREKEGEEVEEEGVGGRCKVVEYG
jgi:hypothetical protein